MALPTPTGLCLLLLSLGCVIPCEVHAAGTRQGVLARRLRSDFRDLKPSAVYRKARQAQPQQARQEEPGCPPGKEVQEVDEMLVLYSDAELQACVDGTLLATQLDRVDALPFTYGQLASLKRKLDQAYPDGYPNDVIQRLGSLFPLVTPEDIGKWDVKSAEMLESLLRATKGPNSEAQVAALIARYVAGGAQVDEGALGTVATIHPASLCLFSPEQLSLLQPRLLWEVDPGALKDCPLPQKEALYSKAQLAFQNLSGPSYLERMRPYLGGATTEQLRVLSQKNISMDMATFKELRREAILPLTVAEVRGLLGQNVGNLKAEEWHSPVWDWIVQQRQEDLDTLGLGLQGGIPNGYLLLELGDRGARGAYGRHG
ncbi:mesothelin [Echinops telfairi]|uniref:Mesothelin n=1 Tax=Echinops telfairi TaxID=9371 RepID=A0AC55CR51_ECHTE|nr:mesothelin [Echinops telfairi]